jgi:catechol 2,3-dioxygenase-like lactoylglutathione lyase family enzyme
VHFASTRIITDDVARLAAFYQHATGVPVTWSTPDFAEVRTQRATLAIGSTRTVALFAPTSPGAVRTGTNRSVILEFLVEDVDAVHRRLTTPSTDAAADAVDADPTGVDVVTEPTTMPWGNRSLLVRDPDGNLVNFFALPTAAAAESPVD